MTPAEAFDAARRLAEREKWMSWRYSIRLEAGAAEYWLGQGDVDKAEEHARRTLEAASSCGTRKYVAIARGLLAEVAARRGNRGLAREELTAAVDVLRQYPVPLIAWKIHSALGRVCADDGDREAARAAFAEAARTIDAIAGNVSESRLRATFLDSAAVRAVRDAVGGRQ
jgi:tetratricopeptide (TPR) repeat protein